jgi:hypothetical protein
MRENRERKIMQRNIKRLSAEGMTLLSLLIISSCKPPAAQKEEPGVAPVPEAQENAKAQEEGAGIEEELKAEEGAGTREEPKAEEGAGIEEEPKAEEGAGIKEEPKAEEGAAIKEEPKTEEEGEDPILAMADKVESPSAKVRVLGSLAMARLHAGDVAAALQLLGHCREVLEGIDDAEIRLGVAENLRVSLEGLESTDEISEYRKQLAILMEEIRSEGDPTRHLTVNITSPDAKAKFLGLLAGALFQAGDRTQALQVLEKAQGIASALEGSERIIALSHIASSQMRAGLAKEASVQFRDMLAAVSRVDSKDSQLGLYEHLDSELDEFRENELVGELIKEISGKLRAIRYQDDPSLLLVDGIADSGGRVQVFCGLAVSLFEAGNHAQSGKMLSKAGELIEKIEDAGILAPALARLAVAQARVGKGEEAKQSLKKVEEVMAGLEGLDVRLTALSDVLDAVPVTGIKEQTQWMLSKSIELSTLIQGHASKAMRQALGLVERMEEGEDKALAMLQVASEMGKAFPAGGFAQLHFRLAGFYHQGNYMEKSLKAASHHYQEAARQGHADAQVALALMHLQGEAIAPDSKKAAVWFKDAAGQGHAEAQVSLGMMYALGKGVEKDLVVAHKWVSLAAAQGHGEAKAALAELAGKLTPAQLERSAELVKTGKGPSQGTASDAEQAGDGKKPEK